MKVHFRPLQFGGWGSYQEWVDHDFMSRPGFDGTVAGEGPEPEPETPEPEPVAAVEIPDDSADTADLGDAEVLEYEDELVIRPYVRTGGRASTNYDLRLETMLVSRIPWHQLTDDHRPSQFSDVGRICTLCESPLSVAELSAYLRAPLGVVRILIGDALSQGLVLMHENADDATGRPSLDILRRVHEGLLRL